MVFFGVSSVTNWRIGIAGCCLFLALSNSVPADQPMEFNYQAKLSAGSGVPLSGQHTVFFSIWSGGVANYGDSGTELFAESADILLTNGLCNHTVGTGNNSFGGPLAESMFQAANPLYLQVAVDTVGNVILPRTQLESVPFAVESRNGVPPGFLILGTTSTAPPGYTSVGSLPIGHSWLPLTPVPTALAFAGYASFGSKISEIGGIAVTPSTQIVGNNQEYDTTNDSWSIRPGMPTPRGILTSSYLGGYIHSVGGITTTTGVEPGVAIDEVYSVADSTWTTTQSLNTARLAHTAAVANGQLFVFGGTDQNSAGYSILDSVEGFNPGTHTWTPKTSMPTPRYYASSVAIGNEIYVLGGFESQTTTSKANEVYNAVGNSWSFKAPIPTEISLAGTAVYGGKIYLIGGLSNVTTPLTSIEVYDPGTNTWSTGISLPGSRLNLGATAVNSNLYAVGGMSNAATPTSENDVLQLQNYALFSKN